MKNESIKNLVQDIIDKKINDVTPEQSLEIISHYIDTSDHQNKNLEGKDATIFIGNSDAGKSTFINHLAGCMLELIIPNQSIIKDEIIVVKSKKRGGPKDEIMEIGHSLRAQTFYLNSYFEKSLKTFLVDCPGFADNRGYIINIINSINIKNLLGKIKNLKVVIVISYKSMLINRGASLKDLIDNLKALFGNEENILENKESILVLISKLPENVHLDKIKKFFEMDKEKFVKKLSSRIMAYDPLNKKIKGRLSKNEILKKIKNLKSIRNSKKMFKINLTFKDIKKLNEIIDFIQKRIVILLEANDFKNSSIILKKLKKITLLENINVKSYYDKFILNIKCKFIEKKDSIMKKLIYKKKFKSAKKEIEILEKNIRDFDAIPNIISLNSLRNILNTAIKDYEKEINRITRQKKETLEALEKVDEIEEELEKNKIIEIEKKKKIENQNMNFDFQIQSRRNIINDINQSNIIQNENLEKIKEEQRSRMIKKRRQENLRSMENYESTHNIKKTVIPTKKTECHIF